MEAHMINKDGDHPRGYEYPPPSIEGGSVGHKPAGNVKNLTQANLDKLRKAVSTVSESLKTPKLIPKP
jgi:hypothetical protein